MMVTMMNVSTGTKCMFSFNNASSDYHHLCKCGKCNTTTHCHSELCSVYRYLPSVGVCETGCVQHLPSLV